MTDTSLLVCSLPMPETRNPSLVCVSQKQLWSQVPSLPTEINGTCDHSWLRMLLGNAPSRTGEVTFSLLYSYFSSAEFVWNWTKAQISAFTLIQMNCTNRVITTEFVLIEPNMQRGNTPLKKDISLRKEFWHNFMSF